MRLPLAPFKHEHDAEILRLAVPAFGALVAEPLFLLADSAIIGHLGTPELAGVGIASAIIGTAISLCVFLAYGTTSTVARMVGAGNFGGALRRGIDGLWLALIVGVVLAVLGLVFAPTTTGWFDADTEVTGFAITYMRVSMFGIPAMLVVLAMTGVLRGLQDTRTPLVVAAVASIVNIILDLALVYGFGLGVAGSALGTVLAQWGSAAAYVYVVLNGTRGLQVRLLPVWSGIAAGLSASVPLLIRTLSLQAVLVGSTVVAARLGSEQLAAHQVAITIWAAVGLALDAVAIAGQALVGRYLGAADVTGARAATRRMVEWSIGSGIVLGLFLFVSRFWLPPLFTPDPQVQDYLAGVLLIIALVQPLVGWTFALDGVLIGAGDARFLAATQPLTLAVFLPIGAAVLVFDLGLNALWVGMSAWILARLIVLAVRERSDRWAVVGATR